MSCPSLSLRLRSRRRVRAALWAVLAAVVLAPAGGSAATRDVVLVGNAFSGTVSFLDASTHANLGSLNIAPDLATRKFLLFLNPITLAGYQVVKSQKGGENYVDDVALSADGRTLYVSRGILEDVAAFNLVTKKMIWRTNIGGFHADHMALAPSGTRLFVSDTTNALVKVFDTASGRIVGQFAGGTYPHGVDFSPDGARVYVGSIGTTSLPYSLNALKGDRLLTVANASTFAVQRTYRFDLGVRPYVVTPDGGTLYSQLSYRRGFIEYDLTSGSTRRTMSLPATAAGDALFPDNLPANSMHHGLAMSGDGRTICNAGTIDNYIAMVDRATFTVNRIVSGYAKPYWATTSRDGTKCLVSNSNGDYVAVMDFVTGLEVKRVTVGDYPQRIRNGRLDTTIVLSSNPG
jgi:DNA-binding beta-propeller fold protein YncE